MYKAKLEQLVLSPDAAENAFKQSYHQSCCNLIAEINGQLPLIFAKQSKSSRYKIITVSADSGYDGLQQRVLDAFRAAGWRVEPVPGMNSAFIFKPNNDKEVSNVPTNL